jgi:hypothetical protein
MGIETMKDISDKRRRLGTLPRDPIQAFMVRVTAALGGESVLGIYPVSPELREDTSITSPPVQMRKPSPVFWLSA